MRPLYTKSDVAVILYDADLLDQIDSRFFDPEHWRARRALMGEARGRGTVWFVRDGGHDWVLRHYHRGGFFAPLLGDRYLWHGRARTRALREWRLLAALHERDLPVPRPVAAHVRRTGLIYRADLITERIPEAESLARLAARGPLPPEVWVAIGRCVRRFHDFGLWHADLNAHNILLAGAQVYLVDFDRGRLRRPGSWQAGNLARLQRSLEKLKRTQATFHYDPSCWAKLREGYKEAPASSGHSSSIASR